MDYRGGDPDGMRLLRRELQLAGLELARTRAEVEQTMNEVCVATTVPMDLRRIEAWIDNTAMRLALAISMLDERHRPDPRPDTVSGFPNGHAGDCGLMEQGIGTTVDVVAKRIHDLREDLNNLRELRPTGPFSFGGHVEQAESRQGQLVKQLKTWSTTGPCPDSLTVDVARQYADLPIRAELGWPAAAATSPSVAKASHHDWWDVDLSPLATVAGEVAAAAGAAVAVGATVARAAGPAAASVGL